MFRRAESLSDTDGRDIQTSILMRWDKEGRRRWHVCLTPTMEKPHDLGVAPCDFRFWVHSGILRIVRNGKIEESQLFVSCVGEVKKGERIGFLVQDYAQIGAVSVEPQIKVVFSTKKE